VQRSVPVSVRTVLEISHDIDYHSKELVKLSAEIASVLNNSGTKPELFFDEQKHTIRWRAVDYAGGSGSIKLSKKQFALIKTLWNGEDQAATLDKIEEAVYSETESFVKKQTLLMLVSRARNSVIGSGFPYEIERIKNAETAELSGYQLVCKNNDIS